MLPISSVVLIELLKELSAEVNTKTLPYLLTMDPNDVSKALSRLKGGKKDQNKKEYVAYWPSADGWYLGATEIVKKKEEYIFNCKCEGLSKLLDCCPESGDEITSLRDRFTLIFDMVFEREYQKDIIKIRKQLTEKLTYYGVSTDEIGTIKSLKSYKAISKYLVDSAIRNAENKTTILNPRRMLDAAKEREKISTQGQKETETNISASGTVSENSSNDEVLAYRTYAELHQMGLSAEDVANQLIENDKKCFGDIGKHAGTAAQWAKHIESTENWGFLCRGTEIVADWACTFLTSEQEMELRAGSSFYGENLTIDRVATENATPDGEVAVHLLALSINREYQCQENWMKLWRAFGERLQKLAQNGVYYRSISTCLFRKNNEHIVRMFEDMGFNKLRAGAENGEIYWMDLTYSIPEAFQRVLPNTDLRELYEEYWGKTITYRQLTSADRLTDQQLLDVSALIYGTDRYIFEAVFGSREQCRRILPRVFSMKHDKMFNLENLFVAETEDNRIIGIILHKKGSLNWCSEYVQLAAKLVGVQLPDSVHAAEAEYFTRYNTGEETRSVLNFCVNNNWCSRDIRVGKDMMKAFVNAFRTDRMRLYVLRETLPELDVYLENGFLQLEGTCRGWSANDRPLPCDILVRPADV